MMTKFSSNSVNSIAKWPFSSIATFKLDSSISESDQTTSQVSIDVCDRFPLRIASLPCSIVVAKLSRIISVTPSSGYEIVNSLPVCLLV